MRLSDLKSERLIPFQAHNEDEESIEARLSWVCNAFDDFVHTIDARRLALAAPYSLDAIRAMTDAELQQYFLEFGIAKYYPDIARSAREMMLYNEMRYFRKLGTVAALEAMVQYIFGENPIDLTLKDCLAFDENGVLTDASLYDLYDVIITAENPVLGAFELGRISANLTRFNRTTQKLRAITMRYSGGECTAYAGAGSVEYAAHYENWEICTLNSETGDDPRKPLMFKSLENGSTVKIKNSSTSNRYEISYDEETWTSYAFERAITLDEGEKVYFRCTYYTPTNGNSYYVRFVLTGKLEAYNNVNSMYSTDFSNTTTLTQQYVFYSLFNSCRSLYRAPLLPATSLSTACYAGMFSGCSSLVEPPVLPATTLAASCYASMFLGCAALIKAPELPATDLATSCYYRMFRYCTHLAEVKCAAVNPPSGESTFVGACSDWLDGAAASGTFYADTNATWTNGANGIPSGWTRVSLL